MRFRVPGRRVAALFFAILVLCGVASAETFDLLVWPYCPPGTLCGFASEQELRDKVYEIVQEMNLQWRPVGYSFRPTIMGINSGNPDYFNTRTCVDNLSYCDDLATECTDPVIDCGGGSCVPRNVCNDLTTECLTDFECESQDLGKCLELNKQQRKNWRQEVAVNYPAAISIMVTERGGKCCSNVANPSKFGDTMFGIWCAAGGTVLGTGSTWAHEMGHHWCLSHTFTHQDFADTMPDPSVHDHDANVGGVFDTPSDPTVLEKSDRLLICDDNSSCETSPCAVGTCNTVVFENHEYCTATELTDVSDSSPHDTYCSTECWICDGGDCGPNELGAPSLTQYEPDAFGAMNYFGSACRGPVVVDGVRTEAFSADSIARIHWCRQNVPVRAPAALPDVCGMVGDTDTDNDGICNTDDNCPVTPNTSQKDFDNDGFGDACDLCPLHPLPTGDLDNDGIGDICDTDRDDDGCENWEDQHPDDDTGTVAVIQHVGCFIEFSTVDFPEGEDFDDDGIADCIDLDDDADEICDDGGTYPPDPDLGIPKGCTGDDPCPLMFGVGPCQYVDAGAPCPPLWLECVGSGCQEFYLRITDETNPVDTIVDEFRIVNDTIYAWAPVGLSAAELAASVLGPGAPAPAALGAGTTRRIEIWSRSPDEFVALVAEYDPASDVLLDEINHGPVIAITPLMDGGPPLAVAARFAASGQSVSAAADQDGDGRPDWADNCVLASNFVQVDTDRDGFGNACDADLDNDGLVTPADVGAVAACDGADLTIHAPLAEPPDLDPEWEIDGFQPDSPDPAAIELAERCADADLNGDRLVDSSDVGLADAMLGAIPGPSSKINRSPVALAGGDQEGSCGVPVSLDGCASFDTDGHPLSYHWSSSTCVFDDAAACQTEATCNAGSNDVILVVDDGTIPSTPDSVVVSVVGCEPAGEVPATLMVAKGTLDGSLLLSWESGCVDTDNYGIYEGTIGDWYSHVRVTCSDGDAGPLSETISASGGDRYYLVTPRNETEGPPGRDHLGRLRPQAPPDERCVVVQSDSCE